MKRIVTFIILLCITCYVFAIRESRPTPLDGRIRKMVYTSQDILKHTGYYGYQTTMELSKSETVTNLSMGDSTGWKIAYSKNMIFLKPIEKNAETNMTLITNKRKYFFELRAEETLDIRDPGMAFYIKFVYPDEEENNNVKESASKATDIALEHPEKFNFNYLISGSEEIAPINIFDDGSFTYLQFRDKDTEIPAIFSVDENQKESMVNFRLDPDNKNMIIIEQVFNKLSLRAGNKITCVFNEARKECKKLKYLKNDIMSL